MNLKDKLKGGDIMKGVFLAHFIVLLHVLLIAVAGVAVLLLGGLARNLIWVLLGGIVLMLVLFLFLYRRVKSHGGDLLRSLERSGALHGRPIEVRFLGGMMSFRVGSSDSAAVLGSDTKKPMAQIEDAQAVRKRELAELAQLLADNLISADEFARARRKIIDGR